MKIFKSIAVLALFAGLAGGSASCVVIKKDNGKHKGWYKNPNNPHHPNTTNPGHTKESPAPKGPGKSNGKSHKH